MILETANKKTYQLIIMPTIMLLIDQSIFHSVDWISQLAI